MKKQNFSTLVNRIILSLGFTSFVLVGMASAASTQDPGNSPDASIKYVGSSNGQPVFKVDLENTSGTPYYLTIRDDQGLVLYTEKIKEKEFSKKFRFESDRDNVKLTFTVEGNKSKQSQEFKVNTKTKFENDVVVTTL